jgi:dinuclear metal center YbgI/SA1388 family protein
LTTHREIYNYLNKIAPYEDAEDWDPTGPTLGWLDDQTTAAVISLDLTSQAYELALKNKCNLIITHHPFIFSPINQLITDDFEQGLLLKLAEKRISSISCHTNLDAAIEGVATAFVETALTKDSYLKNPEILIPLEDKAEVGHGRIVTLNQEQLLSKLLVQVEHNLSSRIQVNTDQDRDVKRIAFTPGAFEESWIPELKKQNIDLLITGEIKHHATVMLHERSIALFAAGHGASEQTVIPLLKHKLAEEFSEIYFVENPGINYNRLRSE